MIGEMGKAVGRDGRYNGGRQQGWVLGETGQGRVGRGDDGVSG